MIGFTYSSSSFRSSVSAAAALAITAMIAWGIHAYAGYASRNPNPSTSVAQIEAGTRDARVG
jgi:hypothetical protein